ncbi:MAG TPA: alpha/beta hydrolase [Gemmatimonadales bacterium]|nr:alpha/beta hydrolase [Gemmatimonadales bacterium]
MRGVRRVLASLLFVLVAAYLGLLLLLRLNEPRLLYYPGPRGALLPPPPGLALPIERVGLRTGDGVGLGAWVIRTDDAAPWLLICHGNGGNISDAGRPFHYAGLRAAGLNLLAFDYRGYGESEGTPSEAGLYLDAEAAYRFLRDSLGVPAGRIVLFGHSLGSAVAVELARRVPAAGLVLDGALTSVPDRAQEIYPYLPVRWIAASRYASRDKIGGLTLPKLFLHAEHDEVVPIAHGRRLFAAAPEPKRFVTLAGGHADAFERDSAVYFGEIRRFVAELGGQASP